MSGPREKIQFSLAVWGRGKQLVDSNFNVLSCPMKEQVYLGIDLGAESGRVMAGAWNGSPDPRRRIAPLFQRPGAGGGDLALGRAAPVVGDSARPGRGRQTFRRQGGLGGSGHLGGGFCIVDKERGDARAALSLPGRAGGGDVRAGVRTGAAGGNLRPDRPAIHGDQHPLPIAGPATRPARICWRRRIAC